MINRKIICKSGPKSTSTGLTTDTLRYRINIFFLDEFIIHTQNNMYIRSIESYYHSVAVSQRNFVAAKCRVNWPQRLRLRKNRLRGKPETVVALSLVAKDARRIVCPWQQLLEQVGDDDAWRQHDVRESGTRRDPNAGNSRIVASTVVGLFLPAEPKKSSEIRCRSRKVPTPNLDTSGHRSNTSIIDAINRERKCAENYNKCHNNFFSWTAISILVISNHNSFGVLFDKIVSVYFIRETY